jgi:hypothetical protein
MAKNLEELKEELYAAFNVAAEFSNPNRFTATVVVSSIQSAAMTAASIAEVERTLTERQLQRK